MNYYISDLNIGYEPAFNKNKIEIGEKFKTMVFLRVCIYFYKRIDI